MHHPRHMIREIGTAFVVLGLYLLIILTPLHQARATQLDFAALGYQTTEAGWVLCSPATERGEGKTLVSKCPATGIGKHQLVAPTPTIIPLGPSVVMVALAYPALPQHLAEPRFNPSAPPRAPPASA